MLTADASWFARKHVPKMALEALQLLYTAHYIHMSPWTDPAAAALLNESELPPAKSNGFRGYKPYNPHMALSRWVASHIDAYLTVVDYAFAILREYTTRTGKVSEAMTPHLNWLADNAPITISRDDGGMHPMPCYVIKGKVAIPWSWNDVYELYDSYFRTEKADMLRDLVKELDRPGLLEWLEDGVEDGAHLSPDEIAAQRRIPVLEAKAAKRVKFGKRRRLHGQEHLVRPPKRTRHLPLPLDR